MDQIQTVETIRAFTTAAGTLLFTAAIGLGTTTLGYPAVAVADPNNGGGTSGSGRMGHRRLRLLHEKTTRPLYTIEDNLDHHRWCCESTGGVWGSHGCQAPAGGG